MTQPDKFTAHMLVASAAGFASAAASRLLEINLRNSLTELFCSLLALHRCRIDRDPHPGISLLSNADEIKAKAQEILSKL